MFLVHHNLNTVVSLIADSTVVCMSRVSFRGGGRGQSPPLSSIWPPLRIVYITVYIIPDIPNTDY